jgi:hypothetical protein
VLFQTVKIQRPTVDKICAECFNGLPEKKEANKKVKRKYEKKNRQYVSSTVELRGVSSCYICIGFTARVERNILGSFLNHNSKIMEVLKWNC